VIILTKLQRAAALLRFKPFEVSTEEGRSKERLRRAALTALSSGGARAVGMLASLVTLPLTFGYLGPERYGLWMVLLSIIGVMGFADLGIGNGLVNTVSEAYGKDDEALAREYITSAFAMLLAIAAVLAVAAAVAFPFIPWMRVFNVKSATVAAEGSCAFLVLYGWFVVNIPLGVIIRVQSGLQKGYMPQLIGAAGSLVTLLALLAVIGLHGSLAWLVFGSTCGAIVSTLVNGWLLFREHPGLFPTLDAYRGKAAGKIFKLGLMFFVLQCAMALGYTSDNIVITQVLGAAAVAAYAVPQKLFSVISMVVGMAITPLWPAYGEALARGDARWIRRTFWASLWGTLGVTVPCCTALVLAGPWVLRVFFGKALHASLALLIVLALWSIVAAVSLPIAMLLNGAGYLRIQTIVAVVSSLLNLALSIVFTRKFGVIGVCLGSIITQVLIAIPVCSIAIHRFLGQLGKATCKKDCANLIIDSTPAEG